MERAPLFPRQSRRRNGQSASDSQRHRGTIWTDGSRLDRGDVGAAYVWKTPAGWTGYRFHPGTNKEVFDAKVHAMYRALHVPGERQESDRRYTISSDSTAAVGGVWAGTLVLGQRFAVAASEVCSGS